MDENNITIYKKIVWSKIAILQLKNYLDEVRGHLLNYVSFSFSVEQEVRMQEVDQY